MSVIRPFVDVKFNHTKVLTLKCMDLAQSHFTWKTTYAVVSTEMESNSRARFNAKIFVQKFNCAKLLLNECSILFSLINDNEIGFNRARNAQMYGLD